MQRIHQTLITASLLVSLSAISAAHAADISWDNSATDFNANASWVGGTAPTDDLTTDIGVFSGSPAFQPTLTADRSIAGLRFSSDGWTLGGGFTLTLGEGDPNNEDPDSELGRSLDLNSDNANLIINANLNLAGNAAWGGNSGSTITVNGVISGSNNLRFGDGDGTFPGRNYYELNAANTYTGQTIIRHGTARIGNNQAFGTGRFIMSRATFAAQPTIEAIGGNRAIANRFGAGIRLDGSNDLTINGGSAYSSDTVRPTFANVGTGTLILAGQIGDASGGFVTSIKEHTFTGSGTIRITGNTSNIGMNQNDNDGLIVAGSRVEFDKAAGFNVSGGNTRINAGGLAAWLESDQLGDTRRLIMAGGTADFNGFDETTGDLTLIGDSVLDLGGTSNLAFTDSSNQNWATNILTITGFDLANSSLRFGTDANGLTTAQLALLSFSDFGGVGGQIDDSGFVTPIPEPASLVLLAAGGALMLSRRRK